MKFPDAQEHARAILESARGDCQTALDRVPVLRQFGFAEDYCRKLEALLCSQAETLLPVANHGDQ
jgi:hypothetical protein